MSEYIYLLQTVQKEETSAKLKEKMPKCPICGGSVFLSHDVVDGYDMGYSAGCTSFRINDGKHGINDIEDKRSPRVIGFSFRETYNNWLRYCKRMEKLLN